MNDSFLEPIQTHLGNMKPLDWSPLLVIVWEVRVVVEHAAFVELLDQRIGLGGGVLLFDVASLHSFPLTPTGLLRFCSSLEFDFHPGQGLVFAKKVVREDIL